VLDGDTTLEVLAGDVEPDRLDVVFRAHRPRAAILNVDPLGKLARVRELSREHSGTRLVLVASQPTMPRALSCSPLGPAPVWGGMLRRAIS
jgi:hypothetical protein